MFTFGILKKKKKKTKENENETWNRQSYASLQNVQTLIFELYIY